MTPPPPPSPPPRAAAAQESKNHAHWRVIRYSRCLDGINFVAQTRFQY
jgi:hypothetical protein